MTYYFLFYRLGCFDTTIYRTKNAPNFPKLDIHFTLKIFITVIFSLQLNKIIKIKSKNTKTRREKYKW